MQEILKKHFWRLTESKMNGILLDLVYKFSESSKVDYEVNGKAFSLVMC